MVAWHDLCDAGANPIHDPRSLVAEDDGLRHGKHLIPHCDIGVT
jgi:hypothetical protein